MTESGPCVGVTEAESVGRALSASARGGPVPWVVVGAVACTVGASRRALSRGWKLCQYVAWWWWSFLPAGRLGVRGCPLLQPWRVPDRGFASLRWRSGQVDVRARLLRGGYGGRGRSPFRTLVAWRTSELRQQSDDPERNGAEVTERSVAEGRRSAGVSTWRYPSVAWPGAGLASLLWLEREFGIPWSNVSTVMSGEGLG